MVDSQLCLQRHAITELMAWEHMANAGPEKGRSVLVMAEEYCGLLA